MTTPAQERGIQEGSEVRITVNQSRGFKAGDIVTLSRDDETAAPEFRNSVGQTTYINLDHVELANAVPVMVEGGFTQKQKQVLDCFKLILDLATQHRSGVDVSSSFHNTYGICDNIPKCRPSGADSDMIGVVKDNLIRRTNTYSGNYHFPVPCPEKPGDVDAAHSAWDNNRDKWVGEYGALRVRQLEEMIHLVEHEWDEALVRQQTPARRIGLVEGVTVVQSIRHNNALYLFSSDDNSSDPYFEALVGGDRTSIDLRYIRVVKLEDYAADGRSVAEFLADIEKQLAAKLALEKQVAELQAAIKQASGDIAMLDYGLALVHKVKRLNK